TADLSPLSLHDALPISPSPFPVLVNIISILGNNTEIKRRPVRRPHAARPPQGRSPPPASWAAAWAPAAGSDPSPATGTFNSMPRSEEHTSELQSRENLV